jgi:site-specific DNA-methyltransferase (adenine-specific)/adenine-specific DNA-methyltransferase
MAQKIMEGRIIWPKSKTGRPRHKKFALDLQSEFAGFSSFVECGNTNEGTEEMMKIMGQEQFIFPKPRSLIETLLEQTTSPNDIVLDAFAGTGTTGHAVLSVNKTDGGNRHFILIELDATIAKSITAERLKRVIQGYKSQGQNGGEKNVAGLGSGYRYCELGATLFDPAGQIRTEVKYDDLAQHVYFIETGSPLPRAGKKKYPLLGIHEGTAIYLLYDGVLKEKLPQGGNVLTYDILAGLPSHDGPKVIYGNGCRISEPRLRELGIVFRQIPYEVKAS